MGPKIFSKQKGETLYSVNLFPIGGYCAMEGEDDESNDERSFDKAPAYKRFFTILAGPLINLIFAGLLFSFVAFNTGKPSTKIKEFTENSPIKSQGFKINDEIYKVNNKEINEFSDISKSLEDFYKNHNFDTTISVVRGQFTSQLRRKWGLEKSRETYHHHAVDALIIAVSSQLRLWKKQNNPLIAYKEGQFVDSQTGEIISLTDDEYKELVFKAPYDHFVDTLSSKTFEDSILFSYQVDSKFNRKISDATIYATRKAKLDKEKKEYTYTLGKIKDIYSLGTKTPSKTGFYKFLDLYNKDKSQFLMFQKDRKTWDEVIEKIMEQYRPFKEYDKTGKLVDFNPFEKYRQENGPIRKYSKKGNGPEIKSLKYYDILLGKHKNITPEGSRNTVALLSLNPWRTDVYYNMETKKYEFLGLKYADLPFEEGGAYGISTETYNELREKEGIGKNSEFKFTLYKNDLILIKDTETNCQQFFRFWSRTGKDNPKSFEKHKIELKPYEKAKFEKGEELEVLGKVPPSSNQFQKNMQIENLSIYKVKTDVLGNKHFIKKEGDKPKLKF